MENYPFILLPSLALETISKTDQVLQTTEAGATSDVTLPSSIEEGDLLVFHSVVRSTNAAPDLSPLTSIGFTQAVQNSHGIAFLQFITIGFYYKIADSGDAGRVITLPGVFQAGFYACEVYRPVGSIETVTVANAQSEATNSNPAAQTLQANLSSTPQVLLAGYGSSGAISPITFSPAHDNSFNKTTSAYTRSKVYNTTGSSTTVDMDDEGNNLLVSCRIVCA